MSFSHSILRLDSMHRQLNLHTYTEPGAPPEHHGLGSWLKFEELARTGTVDNKVTGQALRAAYARVGGSLEIWEGHVRLRGIQDPDRDHALQQLRSWTWETDVMFELGDLPELLRICAAHQVHALHPLPDPKTVQQVQCESKKLERQARARQHWLPMVTVSLYQQMLLDIWERHLDAQIMIEQSHWAARMVLEHDHSPSFAGLYSNARQQYRHNLIQTFAPDRTG